jgi:hypothetical protein
VFRSRGERHAERTGELSHAPLRERQTLEHRPPRGIGEGVKYGIETFGLMFNHVVEYNPVVLIVNRMVE